MKELYKKVPITFISSITVSEDQFDCTPIHSRQNLRMTASMKEPDYVWNVELLEKISAKPIERNDQELLFR